MRNSMNLLLVILSPATYSFADPAQDINQLKINESNKIPSALKDKAFMRRNTRREAAHSTLMREDCIMRGARIAIILLTLIAKPVFSQVNQLTENKVFQERVKNPLSILVRGRVVGLEGAVLPTAHKSIPYTRVTVRVSKHIFGDSGDVIRIKGYCAMTFVPDPKRALLETLVEGCIWYRVGDDVLIMAEPFSQPSHLPSDLLRPTFVRFISPSSESGEEMVFSQVDCDTRLASKLAREKALARQTPTLKELHAQILPVLEADGTLDAMISQLATLRSK